MNRLCPKAEDRKGVLYTLGGLLRAFASSVLPQLKLGARPARVLALLAACGTPELGFTLYQCPHCHGRHGIPRCCGDRHCPRCLAAKSRQWLEQQTRSLLPTPYYHCVLTLPEDLNALVLANPTRLYPLLFDAAAQSLLQFGHNRLKGDLGISAVLHTWGQQLNLHPHLHCIVTGGALSSDGRRWRSPKQRKFLFPVKAVAALFRGKFLDGVKKMLEKPGALDLPDSSLSDPRVRQRWLSKLYAQKWVVYAKRPFGGPEHVLHYLANYTHRVALSNRRIVAVNEQAQTVTFNWRDYRQGGKVKPLTLSAREFIRRFTMHILPAGLVRIRHYGILGNNRRQRDIPRARALLVRHQSRSPKLPKPTPLQPMLCPHCGQDGLRWVGFIDAEGRTHL
ncbi:MAG: IS91 family transposase, partial [Chloroflexi bacterium]